MWIVRLALARPFTVAVMALLIALVGGLSIASMSKDVFPKVDIPVVALVWGYDGMSADDEVLIDPSKARRTPYVTSKLESTPGPVIATTDYMRAVPEQIRPYVPGEFHTLGADGFGFSDTRAAARRFFKIDAHSLVVQTLQSLVERGEIPADTAVKAHAKYDLNNPNAGKSGNAGGDA